MLTKLLRRETCAACRQCCHFDSYDMWNTPILSAEVREKAQKLLPSAQFVSKGECSCLFRIPALDADDRFACPLLDPDKGCMLGTEKPFDCQIWPFCIMELHGRQMITLAPLCDAVNALPIGTLLRFLKEELGETIFAYAEQNPDVVRPYDALYPVLLWKPQEI